MQKCWKATILGARHLPSFFVPTSGHLDSLCVPTPGVSPGGVGTAGIGWHIKERSMQCLVCQVLHNVNDMVQAI